MNIKSKTVSFFVMMLGLMFHLHAASDQNNLGTVARGAELYNYNCTRCHNPRPADDYTAKGWSVVMPHMREKAHMTREETIAVETFLSSTLTADKLTAFTHTNDQQSGETLVTQFGCRGCHQISGYGGTLGPVLGTASANNNVDFVTQKLRDPTFNQPSSVMPRYPMSDQQLDVIVEFIIDSRLTASEH